MPVYSWLTQVGTPRAWLAFNSSAETILHVQDLAGGEHLSAEDLYHHLEMQGQESACPLSTTL